MPENLNRRQFMKALGLTGAGVGMALGTKHGIVDAAANDKPGEVPKRYWWVKSVDKPTVEIDWKNIQPMSQGQVGRARTEYVGSEREDRLNEISAANSKRWELEGKQGYTTKDVALDQIFRQNMPKFNFMGPQISNTPEERGVPRYEGTPEENFKVIRAAMKFMGAGTVGVVELNENTKKLFFSEDSKGKKYVFENVDIGYETADKYVIPEKATSIIMFTVQMSGETMQRVPTKTGGKAAFHGYARAGFIQNWTHEFIRGLGYHSYGPPSNNGMAPYPGLAVLAGLGEMSRLNRMVTPEYGPICRLGMIMTDLPIQPTKPIDFGVARFCKSCMLCADLCPPKSLSFDKEPTWEIQGGWNQPGKKVYYENSATCRSYWREVTTGCSLCFAACPYSKEDQATIHVLWRASAATVAPGLGAVVSKAYETVFPAELGRPFKSPESWWDLDLPDWGYNSMQGGRKL